MQIVIQAQFSKEDANSCKEFPQHQTAFSLHYCPLSVKEQLSSTYITIIIAKSKQFHGSRRKVNSFQTNPLATILINISILYMAVKTCLRRKVYIKVREIKILMRLIHIQVHFCLFSDLVPAWR